MPTASVATPIDHTLGPRIGMLDPNQRPPPFQNPQEQSSEGRLGEQIFKRPQTLFETCENSAQPVAPGDVLFRAAAIGDDLG